MSKIDPCSGVEIVILLVPNDDGVCFLTSYDYINDGS